VFNSISVRVLKYYNPQLYCDTSYQCNTDVQSITFIKRRSFVASFYSDVNIQLDDSQQATTFVLLCVLFLFILSQKWKDSMTTCWLTSTRQMFWMTIDNFIVLWCCFCYKACCLSVFETRSSLHLKQVRKKAMRIL